MTTFNWSIVSLTRVTVGDETGGVKTVVWECSTGDVDDKKTMPGVLTLDPHNSSLNYTPYEDLTEELVLEWCFADDAEGNPRVDKDAVEASVEAQINWVPTTANGTPW